MVKKLLPIFILLILVFGAISTADAAGVKVIVDGKQLDAECIIVDGRTLAPVRAISEAMGATVKWDNSSKMITIEKTYWDTNSASTEPKVLTAHMWVGKNEGNINGMFAVKMDVPAQIISGSTMIPVKALGDMLQADVNWNQENKTVTVSSTLASSPTEAKTDALKLENDLRSTTENYLNNIGKPDTKDPLYSYGYNVLNFGGDADTIYIKLKNVTVNTLSSRTLYIKLIRNETNEVLASVPFTVKELKANEEVEITMKDFSQDYNDYYHNGMVISATK